MTTHEYGENNYRYYVINILITVTFFAAMLIAYVKTNPWVTTSVIIYVALLSYFLLVRPAIKIYEGTADTEDLNVIGIFPILGLFRKWCPLYQGMVRKLENAKAIRECKHVLKEMEFYFGAEIKHYLRWFFDLEHGYTTEVLENEPALPSVKQHEFEIEVNNFYKLFPKISDSHENHKQRWQILQTMICFMIDYYHNELLNDFEQKIKGVENGYVVENMDIIECLRRKRAKFILHRNPDVNEEAFNKALDKKVGYLRELLSELEDGTDLTVIFNQIKMK